MSSSGKRTILVAGCSGSSRLSPSLTISPHSLRHHTSLISTRRFIPILSHPSSPRLLPWSLNHLKLWHTVTGVPHKVAVRYRRLRSTVSISPITLILVVPLRLRIALPDSNCTIYLLDLRIAYVRRKESGIFWLKRGYRIPTDIMATTPPPSELRIPPTPRHGPGYDSYEPYAPRHSARLASQRSRERRSTPPPSLPNEQAREFRKGTRKQGDTEAGALSPSESIHGSPRKDQLGRPGGCVPTHSLDNAPSSVNDNNNPSDPFDSESTHLKQPFLHEFRTTITNGMLPTPAKTPRKKAVGDVSAASRTLFPSSSTPGRGKKGKKPSAFSLDCFGDEPSGSRTRIEIYTDSRDRIPEVHEHEGNPFYKKPDEKTAATVTRNSAVRPSRRRMVEEVKRDKEVEEAFERDDGMVYVL